jgi:hypothetical protein
LWEQGFGEQSTRPESYLNLMYERIDVAIMVKDPEQGSENDYADKFENYFSESMASNC